MAFEKFKEKASERNEKQIQQAVEKLLTNGQGRQGNRLVIWNDNAQKYFDLGGWGRASLQRHLSELYDLAYAKGQQDKQAA